MPSPNDRRHQKKKTRCKNLRNKIQRSSVGNNSSKDNNPVKDVVPYDPEFAREQTQLHGGYCCVCRRVGFDMQMCSKCAARFCNQKCYHRHNNLLNQKTICGRTRQFKEARARIPQDLKTWLFKNHYQEISTRLCTVLRREIYVLMKGRVWTVLLVQVLVVNTSEVVVQDEDGNWTLFIFHRPEKVEESFWNNVLGILLQPGVFILLLNGCWNVHGDKNSAAVDIFDMQQIKVIPGALS
ncbi:uncharacterized protein LOC131944971 [Physella acuta]|uniref:uncharacterized protein LOC131944971 n=1 Tax=Physella acuta TaxID=109671 RepID=UPI0027DCE2E3|nr:uncharacterized protein LOC131944971 [Physella acuta]